MTDTIPQARRYPTDPVFIYPYEKPFSAVLKREMAELIEEYFDQNAPELKMGVENRIDSLTASSERVLDYEGEIAGEWVVL